jgi:hypothetical protein
MDPVYWSWSLPPSIQQNYHGKYRRDKHKIVNRAELAGVAAALIIEHTLITTDSAGTLWQIRNSILYPQRMKRHKHVKLLLETIVRAPNPAAYLKTPSISTRLKHIMLAS